MITEYLYLIAFMTLTNVPLIKNMAHFDHIFQTLFVYILMFIFNYINNISLSSLRVIGIC